MSNRKFIERLNGAGESWDKNAARARGMQSGGLGFGSLSPYGRLAPNDRLQRRNYEAVGFSFMLMSAPGPESGLP